MRLALVLALAAPSLAAQTFPAPTEADAILKNFSFTSGQSLPELRIHYRTLGKPQRDAQGVVRNAVLITHGTGGSGAQFFQANFAGQLFNPGQLLDSSRHYIICTDGIGAGKSSKPSDGLHARFPHYGYADMVEAQYRLLTESLGVNHLRLVMGTSMGGMQSWVWGERHPDFMDALMPLASQPTQISGRNRTFRRIIIDAIRNAPDWHDGDYTKQPQSLRVAIEMLFFMGQNNLIRQHDMPTLKEADAVLDKYVADQLKTTDANDLLYAVESSWDYDPGPGLEKIRAPLLAINSADDLINPPELGILDREIKRVPRGRAIVIPLSPETHGHQSHTIAILWKDYLAELLSATATAH
jgi:homoserine O-acetyltransferase/O-succinyltransferase